MPYGKMKKGKNPDKGHAVPPGDMKGPGFLSEQRGNNYKSWADGLEKHDEKMLSKQKHMGY